MEPTTMILIAGITWSATAIYLFWLFFAKKWKQRAETAENAFKELLKTYQDVRINKKELIYAQEKIKEREKHFIN